MEMSNEGEMIPCLDFRSGGLGIEEGGEGWREMSEKVREACENHGCFLFMCNEVPRGLCEQMFMGMKQLFDLPEETKHKHISSKPYRSYNAKGPITPFFESFGVDDAPLPTMAEAFTNLMWPKGNSNLCETLKSMSSKMLELSFLFMKMIVVGLQVQDKTGKWIDTKIPQEGFVAIVGDVLKAWSNGRVHAATHRVVMNAEKERYSFGLFASPKDEMEIKVPCELVEDNKHPLRYQPFNYGEYIHYFVSTLKRDAQEVFAGV
ncbi:hypothetical protein RIF29_30018 [Crotalaria pallida]|uniref:Uncharacterized protein n=1 Tax=Crotalaria pallida TaxID=3830 RepID=A0AAN9EGF4_CROPI